jgi:hypothetical protein
MRYLVYEGSAFAAFQIAAELEASSDKEALRLAREILPSGAGELRQGRRTVCRFGRTGGFMLQG